MASLVLITPGWRALTGTLGGAPEKPGGRGSVGHLGAAARTQARAPRLQHRPGPELAPESPGGSALCQGAGPTHLHEIKAGQEGHAVLDHFALWPLLRRHPCRLPGSAFSPGRGVHSAAEARCLLQPQAPGAADVTFPAGTAGASAVRAEPPPLPAPLCSNPAAPRDSRSSASPTLAPTPGFSRRRRPAPSPKLLLQWLPLPAPLPLLSTALARLRGGRGLTSRIGKEGRTPGFCSSEAEETRHPRPSPGSLLDPSRNSNFGIAGEQKPGSCALAHSAKTDLYLREIKTWIAYRKVGRGGNSLRAGCYPRTTSPTEDSLPRRLPGSLGYADSPADKHSLLPVWEW